MYKIIIDMNNGIVLPMMQKAADKGGKEIWNISPMEVILEMKEKILYHLLPEDI